MSPKMLPMEQRIVPADDQGFVTPVASPPRQSLPASPAELAGGNPNASYILPLPTIPPSPYGQYAGGNPMQSGVAKVEARERIVREGPVEATERIYVEHVASQDSLRQIQNLQMENDALRMHARAALENQRMMFSQAASSYEHEARDAVSTEVAQHAAIMESNYQSALNYTQQAAEAAIGQQRDDLIAQAESHIEVQKKQLVSEAELYLTAHEKAATQRYEQVEGNLRREAKENQDLKDKISAIEAEGNLSQQTPGSSSSDNTLEQLRSENSNLRRQCKESQDKLKSLEAEMTQNAMEKDSLRQQIKELKRRSVDRDKEFEESQQEGLCKESHVKVLKKEVDDLKVQLASKSQLYDDYLGMKVQRDELMVQLKEAKDAASKPNAVPEIKTPGTQELIALLQERDLFQKEKITEQKAKIEQLSKEIESYVEDIKSLQRRVNSYSNSAKETIEESAEESADDGEASLFGGGVTSEAEGNLRPGSDWEAESLGGRTAGGDSQATTHEILTALKYKNKEAETLKFQDFLSAPRFRAWKLTFKKKIASGSGRPREAFAWINEIEKATSWEELKSKEGDEYETLNAKIAAGSSDVLHGEFQRKINVMEERAAIKGEMINGRQIAWMIYDHFKLTAQDGAILNFTDLQSVTLKGDNVAQFMNNWEMTLSGMNKIPTDDILESLFQSQIKKSKQLESAFALYEEGITHRGDDHSYERLMKMVNAHLAKRRLDANRNAMDVAIAGKGFAGKGGKGPKILAGDCPTFMKKGHCSRGKSCPFTHDYDRAPPRKPKGKGKGKGKGKPSERGRSSSRDSSKSSRPSRGTSPSGQADAPACRNFLQGKCNNDSCKYWHPPICRFFKQGKCDAGKRCTFLHTGTANPAGAGKPVAKAKTAAEKKATAAKKKARKEVNRAQKKKEEEEKGPKADLAVGNHVASLVWSSFS